MAKYEYKSPILFGNGHLDTLIPHFFRKIPHCDYDRERIPTPDDDFLDLDWSVVGSDKLVILSHGLESSSRAKYVQSMVEHLNIDGFDCLAWNYRGCSEEINNQIQYYHSGATWDLDCVFKHARAKQKYSEIYLVGFSLGGNLTLKYVGERGSSLDSLIRKVCVFSAPCDLKSSAIALDRGLSRIYTDNFLKTLLVKVDKKKELIKEKGINLEGIGSIKSLRDFDNRITAPLHGFIDANDYYKKASSKQYLCEIKVPTLMINAVNDPFLGDGCYPFKESENNEYLTFIAPAHGGHCGFMLRTNKNLYWSDQQVLNFFSS